MAGFQGRSQSHQHSQKHGHDFSQIGRKKKNHRLTDIFIDTPALLDGPLNGSKVVVRQNDLRGLSGHIRTVPSHGNPNVRSLQGRRIVHTVSGHGHNLSLCFESPDNTHLGFRRHPGEDPHIIQLSQKGFFPQAP